MFHEYRDQYTGFDPDPDNIEHFILIQRPVVELDNIGLPKDSRNRAEYIVWSEDRAVCDNYKPDSDFRLPHGWHGVEYITGEVVEEYRDQDYWDVAEQYGDPAAVAKEIWDELDAETQAAYHAMARDYCDRYEDDPEAFAISYMIECAPVSDGELYARIAEAALLRAGYMWVQPCQMLSGFTCVAVLAYIGGEKVR
jgi:hypothetical protein